MDAFTHEVTEKTRHLFVQRKYALRSSTTEKYAYEFGLSQMREEMMEIARAHIASTERQRDELLAALHETAQMLSRDEPRLLVYGKLALRILRAAIARARSPSPVRLGQGGSGQAGEATD